MKRATTFARRNLREILSDPLSYAFCLGLPVVMLFIFRIIGNYAGGATPMFELEQVVPGIIAFSFNFVMLYIAILVSRDRAGSLLLRLLTSPMRAGEYLIGYALPGFGIGLGQVLVCFLTALVLGLADGKGFPVFSFGQLVLLCLSMLPILLFFISFGILAGALFSDKAAPGICSVIISLSGFLSGAWMPVEQMGDYEVICMCLPFYPAVRLGRAVTCSAMAGKGTVPGFLFITLGYAMAAALFGVLAMVRVMRRDNK